MNARQAIARSISHNEIVTIPASSDAQSALILASEDWASNGEITEYWGADDDGSKWRVHLDHTPVIDHCGRARTQEELDELRAEYDVCS